MKIDEDTHQTGGYSFFYPHTHQVTDLKIKPKGTVLVKGLKNED